jgi:hypothetical protein
MKENKRSREKKRESSIQRRHLAIPELEELGSE